jgi:hypothetical protein
MIEPPPDQISREKEQKRINTLYSEGAITAEQWSVLFDALSNPYLWNKYGRITGKVKEDSKQAAGHH